MGWVACTQVSNRMMCEVLQPGDQIDFAQYLVRGDNKALMLEVIPRWPRPVCELGSCTGGVET
jgi:hypothetical protein